MLSRRLRRRQVLRCAALSCTALAAWASLLGASRRLLRAAACLPPSIFAPLLPLLSAGSTTAPWRT